MFVLRVRVSVFVHYYEKCKQNKQVSRHGRTYNFLSNEPNHLNAHFVFSRIVEKLEGFFTEM